MERQRNWLGLAALILAGLALLVALGGRFSGPRMVAYGYQEAVPAAPAAPAAPRFERGQAMPFADNLQREFGPSDHSARGFGPGFERGHGFGPRHGFGPLGMIFGLVGFLTKLAALGMLAWLLLRLFKQRSAGLPPAAPTTPAGHDPRVE